MKPEDNKAKSAEQPLSSQEKVNNLVAGRKKEAQDLRESGQTLEAVLTKFDNDYGPMQDLYKERTGVDLISDPIGSAQHEIPITKKCSVVLPTYNNTARLRACLLALQESSFNAKYPQGFEVVIVDDGSTKEDIAGFVSGMNLQDVNVKVFRQTNGGAAKARYSGALNAKGDVVIMTDPDVVYTPTMVEEYMKRHQILDGAAFFGFWNDIPPEDERLKAERIKTGSLGELPYNFDWDQRISQDAMVDCDWLRKAGHRKPLPIATDGGGWGKWTTASLAWGFSVSASRKDFVETFAGNDDRFNGWGLNDESMVSQLIANGLYLIPNTGGIGYHQDHTSNRDPSRWQNNRRVWADNLKSPAKHQDANNPAPTDASLVLEIKNHRKDRKEPVGVPKPNAAEQARVQLKLGLYPQALESFNRAEREHPSDYWTIHDKAATLTAIGGEVNVREAVKLLESIIDVNPNESWAQSSLAIAYGRAGEYQKCLAAYQEALRFSPDNWQAQLVEPPDGDAAKRATEIYDRGVKNLLDRGKPRSALTYFEGAIALVGEEKLPWAVFDKGRALMALEYPDDALKQLARAKQLMPDQSWVDSKIGVIYEQKGDRNLARLNYQKALDIWPDNWEAKKGLERLNSSPQDQKKI